MKPEWGTKRICTKCDAHFYDLNKPEFQCVKCEASYTPEDFILVRGKLSDSASKKEARKKIETLPLEEQMEEVEPEIDPEVLIEDADDLGDDDVPPVLGPEEEENE